MKAEIEGIINNNIPVNHALWDIEASRFIRCASSKAAAEIEGLVAEELRNARQEGKDSVEVSVMGLETELAAKEAELATMREALEDVEWETNYGDLPYCPWCREDEDDGHAPDCQRQKALAASKEETRDEKS